MEEVMVIKSSEFENLARRIFDGESFVHDHHGIMREYIYSNYFFIERAKAEMDQSVRQIIPYVVVKNANLVFLLRRLPRQTERRLHGKLSVGVGGHVNPFEEDSDDIILGGLYREVNEELSLPFEDASLSFLGIINDDIDDVSRYHLGLVFVIEIEDTSKVHIVEKEKMIGEWVDIKDISHHLQKDEMESWSQIILRYLLKTA